MDVYLAARDMITPVDWSIVHNSARLNRRFEQS